MDGGACHISMDIDIVCVDDVDLDDESKGHYYVTDGIPLCLAGGDFEFNARHESDNREEHTLSKFY